MKRIFFSVGWMDGEKETTTNTPHPYVDDYKQWKQRYDRENLSVGHAMSKQSLFRSHHSLSSSPIPTWAKLHHRLLLGPKLHQRSPWASRNLIGKLISSQLFI
ncbi:hypothetical protein AVEN_44549-1 [Araneus ventricosus]|uniref:Uncharacterized protein n=1 Tax=Araneus ventricosus TaxID=182803 RepID=A0A4Y2LHC1_ARAVE|nr:hypothetical protein AVEN_44549-1 [Araneus ventricosus]